MSHHVSRRTFLSAIPVTLAPLGLASHQTLLGSELLPGAGRTNRELESLIELLIETPPDRRVAVLGEELRQGLSYRSLLTAVYLAAVRVESIHPIAMVHAANWIAASLPARDTFLPLVWLWSNIGGALDAAITKNEYVLRRPEKHLPSASKALESFHAAMMAKDHDGAEMAALSLSRSIGGRQTMELLWEYVVRDSDDLGHKVIQFSNSWRTLDAIGWEFAENPLRFLVVYSAREATGDTTYAAMRERAVQVLPTLPPDWTASIADEKATLELYEEIRAARTAQSVDLACQQLSSGTIKAGSIWDAIHLAAMEVSARFDTREGIRGWPVHAVTSTNALRYSFRTVLESRTRLLVLLQAICWVSDKMTGLALKRGRLRDLRITRLDPVDVPSDSADAAAQIFDLLPDKSDARVDKLHRDKDDLASRSALSLVQSASGRHNFAAVATTHLNAKANNSHDYKYTAAAFEDVSSISERWRPAFLAATVNVLHGPASADTPVFKQAREVLT